MREHACDVQQGADVIDIGGQSTRPGATRLSTQEELHRVVPVIRYGSCLPPNHIALCDQWCLCLAGSCAMQAALYLLVPCVVLQFDLSDLFPSSCCICCLYLVVGVDRLCGLYCVHCALALLQQHCSQLLCDLTLQGHARNHSITNPCCRYSCTNTMPCG